MHRKSCTHIQSSSNHSSPNVETTKCPPTGKQIHSGRFDYRRNDIQLSGEGDRLGHSSRDLDSSGGRSRAPRPTRFPLCAVSGTVLTQAPALPPALPECTSLVCSARARGLSDDEVASALGRPPDLRAQPGPRGLTQRPAEATLSSLRRAGRKGPGMVLGTAEGPGLPAVPLQLLGLIGAVEKLPLEELYRDDSKYEHEEHVDDQDVEDVLQGVHHTVKHSLGRGRAVRGRGQPRTRKGLDRDQEGPPGPDGWAGGARRGSVGRGPPPWRTWGWRQC